MELTTTSLPASEVQKTYFYSLQTKEQGKTETWFLMQNMTLLLLIF